MNDKALGSRILQHLVDIGLSKCNITEDEILAESDETTREVLAALLMMHEELEYRELRRQQTLAQLTELTSTLEKRVMAQAQAILVLSTPVIEVVSGILVLPLIGAIDQVRAQQTMEQSLAAVVEHQASVVIIDVTGVSVIDNEVTGYLLNTVEAIGMLGAHVILSGVSPTSAMAFVKLGVDTKKLEPHGSLQSALRSALAMTRRKIVSIETLRALKKRQQSSPEG